MKTFGLIGEKLDHSFSAKYFSEKFLEEKIIDSQYINFELKEISEFKKLIEKNDLSGLNVTIPYKKKIISFLDELSVEAKLIGAVNTIRFSNGKLTGYNTDYIGFTNSIKPILDGRNKALILGNGGAAKAIRYSLEKLQIKHNTISRNSKFDYSDISSNFLNKYDIIINTTSLGSYPNIDSFPKIPYEKLSKKHLLYDLTYNPDQTRFLEYGKNRNTKIKNGLEMLKIQADESWKIWNLKFSKYY